MSEIVIQTRRLTKEFVRDEFHVVALKDVDIEIERGEFVALMGPSGSGKSTLLHVIAAMDKPSTGEVRVLGQDLRRAERPSDCPLAQRERRLHLSELQFDSGADGAGECGAAVEADSPARSENGWNTPRPRSSWSGSATG